MSSQTVDKTSCKSEMAAQRILNRFCDGVWARLHPFAGQILATFLILIAGITVKGDGLLLLSHFAKQFYIFEKTGTVTMSEYVQMRFKGLPWYIFVSVSQTLVMYLGMCGFLHWYFYVRQRDRVEEWKCQPNKFISWEDEKHSILLGTFCSSMASVISGFLSCWTMNGGFTSLYYNVNDYGWWYFLLSIPLLHVVIEALVYYYHRLLHFPRLYKSLHKMHHRYKQPTAFSTSAVHPVEMLLLQSAVVIPMFVIPVHYAVYISLIVYHYYYTILSHSGIKMTSIWPWQPDTTFHDNHHEFFHTNFGLNSKLFDYLHGTLRKEDRIYTEDTYYGYGKKWEEASMKEREEYVKEHKLQKS